VRTLEVDACFGDLGGETLEFGPGAAFPAAGRFEGHAGVLLGGAWL
jgi:hypothetical protein